MTAQKSNDNENFETKFWKSNAFQMFNKYFCKKKISLISFYVWNNEMSENEVKML